MKDAQRTLILNKPLGKVMWKLSLPSIAAMVLYGLNAFMDTVYIGHLMDETALAGVALAYPLTSIMMGLGSWAGTGAANLLSIVLGNGDKDTQHKILPTANLFMLGTTVLFATPAYWFATPLIQMMGGEGAVLQQGVEYFKVVMLASPLWVYGLMLNLVVRAEGKMKTAATMMVYGLFANLVLTPLFIGYFHMGVAGAAWATNIGMAIYAMVGFAYFYRRKASFESPVHQLAYDKVVFRQISRLGLPGFILTMMGLVQAIVVLNAIVHVGTERDLAFFAAANRIQLFLMTPLFGFMRALQPVIGINFGAGNFERVKNSFLLFTKTGFYIVAPFWLALTLFTEASMRLVLPNMAMTANDLWFVKIYMLVLPILPLVFNALTFFPAIKEAKYGSIIGLARQLVFYVPVMLVLPKYLGIQWVYYGATLIDFVVTGWILWMVVKLFKKLGPSRTAMAPSPQATQSMPPA